GPAAQVDLRFEQLVARGTIVFALPRESHLVQGTGHEGLLTWVVVPPVPLIDWPGEFKARRRAGAASLRPRSRLTGGQQNARRHDPSGRVAQLAEQWTLNP